MTIIDKTYTFKISGIKLELVANGKGFYNITRTVSNESEIKEVLISIEVLKSGDSITIERKILVRNRTNKSQLHLEIENNRLYEELGDMKARYYEFVNSEDVEDFKKICADLMSADEKATEEKIEKDYKKYIENKVIDVFLWGQLTHAPKFKREILAYYNANKDKFKDVPHESTRLLSFENEEEFLKIVEEGKAILKAKEEKKQERKEAEAKRIAEAQAKAKKTGEAQVISTWSEDCNNPNLDCDCDNIIEYIDENGKIFTERVHTY